MKRIIYGIIFLTVALACLFLNNYVRLVFLTIAGIVAIWEMKHIQKNMDQTSYIGSIIIGLVLISASTVIPFLQPYLFEVILGIFALMIMFALIVGVLQKNPDGRFAWNSLAIIAYPTVPFAITLVASQNSAWLEIIPMTLASVWVCDSCALGFGKLLGKKKLAPVVSPNKTWAGAIGGSLSSILAGVGIYYLCTWLSSLSFINSTFSYSIVQCIVIAFVLSIFGQFGDLAASLIKRSYGVKDYSHIIPAHGGVMDKFDGLSFAMPIAFMFSYVFSLI